MGQNISISNNNGRLKLKRKKKTTRKPTSTVENSSAASSTISNTHNSKAEESHQSSIIIEDHDYTFPKAASSTPVDLRELPYDTLKSEDDRMNAVCLALLA